MFKLGDSEIELPPKLQPQIVHGCWVFEFNPHYVSLHIRSTSNASLDVYGRELIEDIARHSCAGSTVEMIRQWPRLPDGPKFLIQVGRERVAL